MHSATTELPIQLPSESNLAALVLDPNVRVLLLTAANNGSGTTTCALSLAHELARGSRDRVLLLDASLSAASVSRRLGLEQRTGFTEMLADPDIAVADAVVSLDTLPFDVMPAGGKGHLEAKALGLLFTRLREHYRFIVIDGDAVYANSDSLTIAAQADGVVLVVRAEETRWEVAQAAVQRLQQADARLIGSVFNARRYYMPKWIYDNL